MLGFILGIATGAAMTHFMTARPSKRDATVQVDQQPAWTSPIAMPIKKQEFIPGKLANFWGADS